MSCIQGPAYGSNCLHSSGTNHENADIKVHWGKTDFFLGCHTTSVPAIRNFTGEGGFSLQPVFQAVSVKTKQSGISGRRPEGASTAQLSLLLWACLWSHKANGEGDFVRCTVPSVKLWQGVLKINTLGILRCWATPGMKAHAENMK